MIGTTLYDPDNKSHRSDCYTWNMYVVKTVNMVSDTRATSVLRVALPAVPIIVVPHREAL